MNISFTKYALYFNYHFISPEVPYKDFICAVNLVCDKQQVDLIQRAFNTKYNYLPATYPVLVRRLTMID